MTTISGNGVSQQSRPPCVGFVALEIYPATAGGVGILLTKTIKLLLARGYTVVLLLDVQRHEFEAFNTKHRIEFENGHNLHVYLVDDLCKDDALPVAGFAHLEVRRAARIHSAMEVLKTWHELDIVEYYDYCGPAYYALTATGPREPAIAVRLHNTVELIARKIRSPIDPERLVQFALERACMQGADGLLSPGDAFYEEEIKALYPELNHARAFYSAPVHTPVGQIRYDRKSRNVAFYGRLSTFKGLDTFIRGAVLALQDAGFANWLGKFLIIGPEETVASAFSLDDMKAMIPEHMMDRFEFTGRVRHDELMQYLGSVAFACFANRMESFCYAAHELHTAGVPLVLSDTPAFRDHFEDGETAVFFDRNSPGLAQKMIALAQDEELRGRLSEAGVARVPNYLVDHYQQHLKDMPVRTYPEQAEASCTVMVLTDKTRPKVLETIRTLRGLPVLVMTLDKEGPVRFSGRRWTVTDANGQQVSLDRMPSTDAAIFLRAGDVLNMDWVREARRLLALRPDAGSVGGFFKRGAETVATSYCALPEEALSLGCGLRVAIRLRKGTTFQEALCGWPGESEVSLMIGQRAEKRLNLELPMVAADVTRGIYMPVPSIENILSVDFDRMSRDFLTVYARPSFRLPSDEGQVQAVSINDRAILAETASQPGLLHIRANPNGGEGEVMLLRYFRGRNAIAASWSAVETRGDWSLINDVNGPVQGALRTFSGELRTYVEKGGRIDLLRAPFGGELAIFYGGKMTLVDLKSEMVHDVTLHFGDELEIGPKIQIEKTGTSHGLHARHASLRLKDMNTLFITDSETDFDELVPSQEIRLRTLPAREFDLDLKSSQNSDLSTFARTFGVKTIILSSKLEPTPALARAIDAVDPSVRFGLILCGAFEDEPENPAAARFNASAAWFDLVSKRTNRFGVVSRSRGILKMFEKRGAKTMWLPSDMAQVPELDLKSGGLNLAIIESESVARNMMHMVNAAIMAQAQGTKISSVWLPASYRFDLRHIDEINVDLPIKWYNSVSELDSANIGARRIALACYPDEEWPIGLSQVARYGWLPIAGATSELDESDVLADLLAVTFWEDSLEIAKKISIADRDLDKLLHQYNRFVLARQDDRDACLMSIWAS